MYVLIPLCLCFALSLLKQENREHYVAAVLLKGFASLCFVILGILCSTGTSTARLILIGLIFGCIADVLLNLRRLSATKGQLIFLVGILVFLSGHIVYLAAILPMCRNWILCFIIGATLTALLMVWIFKRISAKKVFKIFGVFYIGAIMILNSTAIGNLITSPAAFTAIFAVGAVLFLVSDVVLILNTFGSESKYSLRIVNIVLYYIGQLLIALSLQFI